MRESLFDSGSNCRGGLADNPKRRVIVLYPVPRVDQWDRAISETILAIAIAILAVSFLV
jgi:hypothetical protein